MHHHPFRREIIVPETPGSENDVCLLADLTGNGWLDVIIGGKFGADNLCWYEAPHWTRHTIGQAYLEAGGVLIDISGNGRLDLVVGEAWGGQSGRQGGGTELFWFEQPKDPRQPWARRVIENGFHKYHNQAVGDVDGDGELEIVIASQFAGIMGYYDIPHDLDVRRWPYENRHLIVDNLSDEGLAVGDVDGDGRTEIAFGTNLFLPPTEPGGRWTRRHLASFDRPAVVLGDINGDGRLELVAAEGEAFPARLAWFDLQSGAMHLLADDLFHPHSLDLADFAGNGALDILVGEMGLHQCPNPRLIIYVNDGAGRFEPVVVSEGVNTHMAVAGDVNGDGKVDVVGKPYLPGRWVDVWWNTW